MLSYFWATDTRWHQFRLQALIRGHCQAGATQADASRVRWSTDHSPSAARLSLETLAEFDQQESLRKFWVVKVTHFISFYCPWMCLALGATGPRKIFDAEGMTRCATVLTPIHTQSQFKPDSPRFMKFACSLRLFWLPARSWLIRHGHLLRYGAATCPWLKQGLGWESVKEWVKLTENGSDSRNGG